MARREAVVYGVRAALAVAEHRPQSILRVFHGEERRKVLAPLLKAMAASRRPYREVPREDLDKLAKSRHHEGVVLFTEPLPLAPLAALLPPAPNASVIALDEVGNPHNLGAIIRSAAWFDAAVLIPRSERQAALSAAAVRIAQGGAEHAPVVGVDDLPSALKTLAEAGYQVLGADQNATRSGLRELPKGPLVIVLGNEAVGLRPATRAACADRIAIPGTGVVESLNVSVSAAVLLAARWSGVRS